MYIYHDGSMNNLKGILYKKHKGFLWLLLIVLMFIPSVVRAGSNRVCQDYELACAGNGEYGHYLVTVTAYVSKKKDANLETTKQCAVHGVLFRGFSGAAGCNSQKALVQDINDSKQQEYLDNLVSGAYLQYTTSIDGALNVIKTGKKYKVVAVIEVDAGRLRKDLEKAGVIRKLGL